jgi:membrane protein required for colicin V production
MNYFDIVVGIILILAIIRGFRNGLIIELASLAALVLGVLGAIKFSSFTEQWLTQHFSNSYIGIIAFILTFIAIVIGVHLIAKGVNKLVEAVALGFINRIMGALFSLVKIGFILSIVMAVFVSFDKTFNIIPEQTRESSILYEPLGEFAPRVFPYLNFDKEDAKNKMQEVITTTT